MVQQQSAASKDLSQCAAGLAGDDRRNTCGSGGVLRSAPSSRKGARPTRWPLQNAAQNLSSKGCSGQHSAIGGLVKLVAGRAAGHQRIAIAGPVARRLPVAHGPVHEGKQVLGHRDIQMRAALARHRAPAMRQQNIQKRRVCARRRYRQSRPAAEPDAVGRPVGQRQKAGVADIVQVVPRASAPFGPVCP